MNFDEQNTFQINSMSLDLTSFRTVLSPSLRSFLGLYFDDKDHLSAVIAALARPPSQTTIRVNTLNCTTEELLSDLQKHLEPLGHTVTKHEVKW